MFNPRLQTPPAKPKHWHWLEHILFPCHFPNSCPSAWVFVCASVRLSVYLFAFLFECHYSVIMYLKPFVNIQCSRLAFLLLPKIHGQRPQCIHVMCVRTCVDILQASLNVCVIMQGGTSPHMCEWVISVLQPSTQPSVTVGPPCSEANHLLPTASRILALLSNNGAAKHTFTHQE